MSSTKTRTWSLGKAAISFALLLWVAAPAFADSNISVVEFGSDGKSLGKYQMTEVRKWIEMDAGGNPQFVFAETSRDDNAIHLEDRSRGIALTLDIAKNSITFGKIGESEEPLYQVISTSADAPSEASPESEKVANSSDEQSQASQSSVRITFGSDGKRLGDYILSAPGKWAELNLEGQPLFAFDEVSRSETAIVVEDKGRNLSLTFDLAARTITFGAIGEAQQPLYDILDLQGATNGTTGGDNADTQEAALPDDGQIVQAGAEQPAPPPPIVRLPTQIKLKHVGWFVGRFTVTWLEFDETGAEVPKIWTSGEQNAPYFYALALPDAATTIRILGEANTGTSWTAALEKTIDHAGNNCYLMAGTKMMATGAVSAEATEETGDDCS